MKVAKTAPDAFKILWGEKVFQKPKKVAEVREILEKRGYNFGDKTLLMALKNAKFLTRKGSKGNYKYVQKYPYWEDKNDKKQRNE